jgi:acyl-CoA reductase-like NAD-dependent aldehyde dehydrogenase
MSGQVCYGIKRIYVDASRLAEFTGAFTDMAARIVPGDGLHPGPRSRHQAVVEFDDAAAIPGADHWSAHLG